LESTPERHADADADANSGDHGRARAIAIWPDSTRNTAIRPRSIA
jgi:hypothetical protein